MLELALGHYRRGQWQQAEQLYLQVLAVDPNQADALHVLAVISGQTGRLDRASEYLRTILRIRPGWAAAHNNLGMVYISQHRLSDAAASFREAVRLDPTFAAAHNNLGNALGELGQPAEAAVSLQEAVRLAPAHAEAHYNLGRAWHAQDKLREAQASFQQATHLKPNYVEAHLQLGIVLEESGDYAEAAACYQKVLHLEPDHAEAHARLGPALANVGHLQISAVRAGGVERRTPADADDYLRRGDALLEQGHLVEAIGSYRQALGCRPNFAEAHNNLGAALLKLGQVEEAEASLEQALHFKSDCATAHHNLGMVFEKQRRLEAALARYREAVRLEPNRADTYLKIANVHKAQGRLDEAIDALQAALQLKPEDQDIHSALAFTLHYHPRYDARMIQEESIRWNRLHAEPLKGLIRPHSNDPDPERRLRIGYVSPDFRDHVDSFFTIPLLSNHDHRQFEVFLYADVATPDSLTERLRRYADVWRSTVGLNNEQLADLIHSDQIDVLVDLKLHTAKNRLLALARKPAPVQVAWLGYPGGTGMSAIDYRLTDPYLDPPRLLDAYYTEESIRLPDTFWCYDPLSDEPPVSDLPAIANGAITFGCLNNFAKVNDGCLELWARVLKAVPDSRLILLAPRDPARERVLEKLESEGVTVGRVEFAADRLPRLEYLRLYHRVDIGLDPFPYNGHTTSLDALWMGVPTITLVGNTAVGRAGWSQLCNLRLNALAAETPEQYVVLASELAGDLARLRELRASLRQRMQQSPLMDGKRFARNMERAYRQIWQRWCEKARPAEPNGKRLPLQSSPNAAVAAPPIHDGMDAARQHYQRGDRQRAEQLCLEILEAAPNQIDALHLLAAIASQTHRDDQAINFLEAVLRHEPDCAAAHNNLGNLFAKQRKLAEAAASFREAARLQPESAVAHNNLGNALREQGLPAEAVASLQQALHIKPDYAEAQQNLGLAWLALNRLAEAQSSFEEAVRLKPGHAEAHLQLGVTLGKLQRHAQAAASLRESVRLQPDGAEAHVNLALALWHLGELDEAIAAFRAALGLNPGAAHIHSHLIFALNYHPGYDAKTIKEECTLWNQQHAEPLAELIQRHTNRPEPELRLRVGYVSPDFREHVDSYFTVPLLSNHDHHRFEVFLYAGVVGPDAVTERLRGYADVWRSTVGLSDEQLAAMIRADQIDILVDLKLHTADNRLLTFARKPAPVQVAWLGYPGTTGLSAMDYRLTDPYLDPPGLFDDCYTERSVRLANTFWCYAPLTDGPSVNALPARTNGLVTFGSLNNFCKINNGCLALWADVLQAVPGSRLLLRAPSGQPRERVSDIFRQKRISASRIEFAETLARQDYLRLHHGIDLALDPLPYNGHTTSLDALWMGVPTLTLVGKTVVGRAGWSQLNNLGLQDLAAETPEEYVALAARLAGDLPRLKELRATLRQRMQQSPLMDGRRFARSIEQAYREMWQAWCQTQ
jgi:predicted O-linked N-acetylglucosamine transferase (SPINDLY family)